MKAVVEIDAGTGRSPKLGPPGTVEWQRRIRHRRPRAPGCRAPRSHRLPGRRRIRFHRRLRRRLGCAAVADRHVGLEPGPRLVPGTAGRRRPLRLDAASGRLPLRQQRGPQRELLSQPPTRRDGSRERTPRAGRGGRSVEPGHLLQVQRCVGAPGRRERRLAARGRRLQSDGRLVVRGGNLVDVEGSVSSGQLRPPHRRALSHEAAAGRSSGQRLRPDRQRPVGHPVSQRLRGALPQWHEGRTGRVGGIGIGVQRMERGLLRHRFVLPEDEPDPSRHGHVHPVAVATPDASSSRCTRLRARGARTRAIRRSARPSMRACRRCEARSAPRRTRRSVAS